MVSRGLGAASGLLLSLGVVAMNTLCRVVASVGALVVVASASHAVIIQGTEPNGLGARAEFTLVNATTLQIRLSNISTGVPTGFSNSDQILTGVSWIFPGGQQITGGTVIIGNLSKTVNFSAGAFSAGEDVSGEWGFGNSAQSGLLGNFITVLQAGSTQFSNVNLDGPAGLSGPQGGLIADPAIIPIGGLGAIQTDVVATLQLSAPLANLNFLSEDLVRFEFGSDAAFITVPTPASGMLALGLLPILSRRRRA